MTAPLSSIRNEPDGIPHTAELVTTHLPLVGHLVSALMLRLPSRMRRDDLAPAAMVALVLAARSFDASMGVPFAAYASSRITGALTDELRSADWATRTVRARLREIDTTRSRASADLGRAPTRLEVAKLAVAPTPQIEANDADVLRAGRPSLQGLTPEDAEKRLPPASSGPEVMLLKREELGELGATILELSPRLRTVVEQSFFADRKLAEIATQTGISESRVSQIRTEAVAYLRDALRPRDPPPATNPRPGRRRSGELAPDATNTLTENHTHHEVTRSEYFCAAAGARTRRELHRASVNPTGRS